MKKIFIVLAAAAMLVSCGGGKKLYFAEVENRVVNDSKAEFDSLSYAFGLSYALTLETQLADLKYDREYFIEMLEKYLTIDYKKMPSLDNLSKSWMKFQRERFIPHMRAKQISNIPNITQKPEVPEIYNEQYNNLMITELVAAMSANDLRAYAAPVNIHYLKQGINDAREILGDAAGSSQPHALDSTAMAKITPMMGSLARFHRVEMPEYNLKRANEWLAYVAKQPDVKTLTIGSDTIYYRVNVAGGAKIEAPTDSISLEYEIYSYNGTLVETTDSRFDKFKQEIADIKNNKTLPDSVRRAYVKMKENEIEKNRMPMITSRQIYIPAIKHCLSEIGEFGSITIWTPAKFGPSQMKGKSARVLPNEPSVINVKVRRVAKGVNVATPMLKKPINGATHQQGKLAQPQPAKPGANIKVVPAPKGEKPAPAAQPASGEFKGSKHTPQQIKVVKK